MDWLDLLSGSQERDEPLYVRIMNKLKESIESGALPASSKLPTNRELASLLDVDRSTVSRAYAELAKDGLIQTHVGRGSFVGKISYREKSFKKRSDRFDSSTNLSWSDAFSQKSNTVSELLSQQSMYRCQSEGAISFAGGIPTEEFYPSEQLEKIVSQLLASGDAREMFSYSPAEGYPGLIGEVQKILAVNGVRASDDEIMIVSGSQQGIDLVSDVLVDADDVVIMEEPSYLWAVSNFKSRRANCLTVPVADAGIELGSLEQLLSAQRAKLLYLMPNYQNPTGNSMSLQNRFKVLELSKKYGVPILEDDFAGDLRYDGNALPSLRALPGGSDLVIHQGTFSKALCPGLRVGWLVAPWPIMSRLRLAKRSCDLSTNSMSQVILSKYLAGGLYQQHLEYVKKSYRSRRDTMIAALDQNLATLEDESGEKIFWTKPLGGLFLWVTLPSNCSAKELLLFAEREGVTFSPGDLFYCQKTKLNCFRLCFIQQDEKAIVEGVCRLGRALTIYFESIKKRRTSSIESSRLYRSENVLI